MEFINFELFSFGGETGRRAGFKIQFLWECGFDSHPKYFIFLFLTNMISLKLNFC